MTTLIFRAGENPTQCSQIPLGIRAENEVTQVALDFSPWAEEFGAGVVQLLVRRDGDSSPYPVVLTQSGTTATWTVSATDLAANGPLQAEFIYTVGTLVKKSEVLRFYVLRDIGAPGSAPDPYETWLDTLIEIAAQAQQDAAAAAGDAADAEAAAQTIQDMGVQADTLEPGSYATVDKIVDPDTGAVTLVFGIPRGQDGSGGGDELWEAGTGATAIVAKNPNSPNVASGAGALAAGAGATASGLCSFAFGSSSQSIGSPVASGAASFAFGLASKASGNYSIAFGQVPESKAVAALAFGDHVIASGRASLVAGRYNLEDENAVDASHGAGARKYLLIIGNGTADNARSNAMTVDWAGNEVLAGKLTLGAAPTANMDAATKQYVDNAIGNGITEDIKAALLQLASKVAYIDADGADYYQDLCDALYPLVSISAVFAQGSTTIYDDASLDSLKPYLTVIGSYEDGRTQEITTYTLSGTLTAGTSTITVTAPNGLTDTFTVTVTHKAGVYRVDNYLTGCATSNTASSVTENTSYSATITASSGYTLTGATVSVTMGGTDITSTAYSNGTISIATVTGVLSITVTAVAVALSSISAAFDQGQNVVYDTDSLDTLKQYLVVTATNSDSTTAIVPSTDYTLSGSLTAGTSTVTVNYSNKTTTFTVTVTHYVQTYVTDGLVAMFDADDNTGSGHDGTATTWKDLVGSYDITVPSGKATWNSDALVLDGTQGNTIHPTTSWPTSTTRTVEIVVEPTSVSASAVIMNVGKEGNGRCIWLAYNSNGIGWCNGSEKLYSYGENPFTGIRHIAVTFGGNYSVSKMVVNGIALEKSGTSNNMSNTSSNLVVGAQGHTGNYALTGKIHAIRIYNRVLTDSELSQNRSIDVSKYGLVI